MLIEDWLVLLTTVLLALDLSAADDTTTTNNPEINTDTSVTPAQDVIENESSPGTVGKLSDWWNDYIAKVKASSPTPVWTKTTDTKPSRKVPFWWMDMEVPSTTRRRHPKLSRYPLGFPQFPLGHHLPKDGVGVGLHDLTEATSLTEPTSTEPQKEETKASSCPPCPCQSTKANCPHCGCQSQSTCHDQKSPNDNKHSDGDNSANSNKKPSDGDSSANDNKKPSDGDDSPNDNKKPSDGDNSGGKDTEGSDSGDEKTTKPFKKCTCKTTPNCCMPNPCCQSFRHCTCGPKLGQGRSGRSGTIIEAAKSNAFCNTLATFCIILSLLLQSLTSI